MSGNEQASFSYTPQQKRIIDADVDNILVSAAAGAGKTAVLTDRIVRRLVDGKVDIRQLLVMTFTEAAAAEMKTRIDKKLNAALANAATARQRLQLNRQLAWLAGASISTIHAFCLGVIRDFSHLLTDADGQPLLDAAFSVDDGIEADLLLDQSLDQLLHQLYAWIDAVREAGFEHSDNSQTPVNPIYALLTEVEHKDSQASFIEAFYRLMDSFASGRTDEPVRDLILQQYRYLRSLPDYQQFVDGRLDTLVQAADDFDSSAYAAELLKMLTLRLDRACSVLPQLETALEQSPAITFIKNKERNKAYHVQFKAIFKTIRQMRQLISAGSVSWDDLVETGQAWQAIELPRNNRSDTDEKTSFMTQFNTYVAELIHFISGACGTKKYKDLFVFDSKPVFIFSSSRIKDDIQSMLPVVKVFYQLVLALDAYYLKQKQLLGFIDFADFEHLALRLLRMDEVNQYYQAKYAEVYVDEYQDTSSIQEAVISAISERNCLMVGDLKQSIYKFRHARPQIFKDKAELYQNSQQGQLIELNRNFRSLSTVLAPVNSLFEQLMSSGAGEIDYDDRQALVAHRQPDDAALKSAHLLVLPLDAPIQPEDGQDNPGEADNRTDWSDDLDDQTKQLEDLSIYEKEAAMAAFQILQIRKETGQDWQAFAILCRTKAMVQKAAAVLQEKKIPVLEGSDAQRFDIPELRLLEACIHLTDNAKQDVPLAAVMRSTLSGDPFSDTELATIRLTADKQCKPRFFHEAVSWYWENGTDQVIRRKLGRFFNVLTNWRQRALYMRIDEWLRLLMSRTQMVGMLSAQPEGAYKIRVLEQLITLATSFEQHQRRGLHAFARYLESLREKEKLSTFFPQETQAFDGVRIMTIHGSKGLEFPVVFIIGSQYKLTPKDNRQALLMSENLGIGFDFADPIQSIRYPSHLKLAMLAEIKASGMAEEMRLLYVALTRARDQFYMIAVVDFNQESKLERLHALVRQAREIVGRTLPDHLVLACRNYLEWLMLCFARGPEADRFFDYKTDAADADRQKSDWVIRHLSPRMLLDQFQPDNRIYSASDKTDQLTDGSLDSSSGSVKVFAESNLDQSSGSADYQSRMSDPLKAVYVDVDQNRETEKQMIQLSRCILDPYRYDRATHTPLKLAVSELKRNEQLPEEGEQINSDGYHWLKQAAAGSLPPETGAMISEQPAKAPLPDLFDMKGINLTLQTTDLNQTIDRAVNRTSHGKKGGAATGTLIHQVFRYLDLENLDRNNGQQSLSHQLDQMLAHNMMTKKDRAALVSWEEDIWAFVCSDLAEDMASAIKVEQAMYREMPFTLAVPVNEIYEDCAGFAQEDRLLIQGMIDCWYEKDGKVTLLDFKSDWIDGSVQEISDILKKKYTLQMTWYARAIKSSIGRLPERCLIWHVRSRRAYSVAIQ